MIAPEILSTLVDDAIKAVVAGGRRVRVVFFSGFALILAAIVLVAMPTFTVWKRAGLPQRLLA